MAQQLGIGVIGLGWMGRVHSSSYRRVPEHFPELGVGLAEMVATAHALEAIGRSAESEAWTSSVAEVVR